MKNGDAPHDMQELVGRLDEVLGNGAFDHDVRSTALIALAFCDLLRESLDGRQRAAVDVARNYWAGMRSDEYASCVTTFADAIDSDRKNGASTKQVAINRLIWTALNRNTGLTGYAADFLVGLGRDAGLGAWQMAGVFSNHIRNNEEWGQVSILFG